MYFFKDLIDGEIYPLYSEPVLQIVLYYAIIGGLGVIVDSILLFALLKQRDIPLDSRFVISCIAGDLIFSFILFVGGCVGFHYGGWGMGRYGCSANAVIVIFSTGVSILSVLGLAAYRYLVAVRSIDVRDRHVNMAIGAIWSGLLFFLAVFLVYYFISTDLEFTGRLVSLQSTGYCYFAMSNPNPMNMVGTILISLAILSPMILQAVAYWQIVSFYLRNAKNRTTKRITQEKKLIEKAVALTFSICWIFFGVKCLYELISQKEVPFWYECITSVFASLIPFLNAVILIKYDAKVRNNIGELLQLIKLGFKRSGNNQAAASGTDLKPPHAGSMPLNVKIASASGDAISSIPPTMVLKMPLNVKIVSASGDAISSIPPTVVLKKDRLETN